MARNGAPVGDRRKKRILVVDDDPSMRELLQLALETHGFRVDVAVTGPKALTLAKRHRPTLALLDLEMSPLNGEAVAAGLRALYSTRDVPLVVISGHPLVEERARLIGAAAYLAKPVELPDLLFTVQSVLASVSASRQSASSGRRGGG